MEDTKTILGVNQFEGTVVTPILKWAIRQELTDDYHLTERELMRESTMPDLFRRRTESFLRQLPEDENGVVPKKYRKKLFGYMFAKAMETTFADADKTRRIDVFYDENDLYKNTVHTNLGELVTHRLQTHVYIGACFAAHYNRYMGKHKDADPIKTLMLALIAVQQIGRRLALWQLEQKRSSDERKSKMTKPERYNWERVQISNWWNGRDLEKSGFTRIINFLEIYAADDFDAKIALAEKLAGIIETSKDERVAMQKILALPELESVCGREKTTHEREAFLEALEQNSVNRREMRELLWEKRLIKHLASKIIPLFEGFAISDYASREALAVRIAEIIKACETEEEFLEKMKQW